MEGQENIFKNLADNIDMVTKQIKDGESKRDDSADFNKDAYWTRISNILKVLSSETTKMSLAYSKKPFPSFKNTEQMSQELEKGILTLVSAYYSLPLSQGVSLRHHLQAAVLQILQCIKNFVLSVIRILNSSSSNERLQWTGAVWEGSDFALIRDNQQCALKSLKETSGLIDDVLSEIEQARENNGQADDSLMEEDLNNDEIWTQQDREVVMACTGLVKTTKIILKKSCESVTKCGDVTSTPGILVLDEMVQIAAGVSSCVDDFVCGIYAPVNYSSLSQNGKILFELNGKILKFLRDSSLTTSEDEKWLDFLTQANTHNHSKLALSMLSLSQDE